MATIIHFPHAPAHARATGEERCFSETYWAIAVCAADGSKTLATMRSPRFLSPRRAYAAPQDERHGGIRSFLLYKFARRQGGPLVRAAHR